MELEEFPSHLHPRRPATAATTPRTSINPSCFCCAVMLIRTPASCFSPLLTVAVGLGSQVTYTKDTYPYMVREPQVVWRRGFRAAEHSLLDMPNRQTLSQIWLVIRPKEPRTLCTVHKLLLRVPGPRLAVPLSIFQALRAPPSHPKHGKA